MFEDFIGSLLLQAVLARHWTRLSELTGHSFQVDSEGFCLRNITEAPLLRYREDIEVPTSDCYIDP